MCSRKLLDGLLPCTTDPLPDTEHSSRIILLLNNLQFLVIFHTPKGFFPIRFKHVCFVPVCTRVWSNFSQRSNFLSSYNLRLFPIDFSLFKIKAPCDKVQHCFAPSWRDRSLCTFRVSFLNSFAYNEAK